MVIASAVFLTGALTACNADDNEALDTRYDNDTRPIGYYTNEGTNQGDRGEGPITQIADQDGDRNEIGENDQNNRTQNNQDNNNINYADGYEGELAQKIANKVKKMENVDDARVVISEENVLVGVDTNDRNDQDVKEKVQNEVQKSTKKNVQVSTDENMFTRIRDVDNNLRNGDGFNEVESDVTGIMNDLGDAVQRPFENNR